MDRGPQLLARHGSPALSDAIRTRPALCADAEHPAVLHRGTENFSKYDSGLLGFSLGYILNNGIAFEGGLEFSALSDAFVGFRYIYRPETIKLWTFAGLGAGSEVDFVNFAKKYYNQRQDNQQTDFDFYETNQRQTQRPCRY